MTGPDHYREAERYAKQADSVFEMVEHEYASRPTVDGRWHVEHAREMGLLHATLALAAATALTGAVAAGAYEDQPDVDAWTEAAGVKPDG